MMSKIRSPFWKRFLDTAKNRLLHPINCEQPPYGWDAVLDAIEDWVCTIDLNATIIRSNTDSRDLFTLPATQIPGKTCCSLLHHRSSPCPAAPSGA